MRVNSTAAHDRRPGNHTVPWSAHAISQHGSLVRDKRKEGKSRRRCTTRTFMMLIMVVVWRRRLVVNYRFLSDRFAGLIHDRGGPGMHPLSGETK